MMRLWQAILLVGVAFLSISSTISAEGADNALAGMNLSISGASYLDLNANGFRDEGEPGLSGRTVRLSCGSVTANLTTDESGNFVFGNLSPDSYRLSQDPVSGWNQTSPGAGYHLVTLTDRSAGGLDFGSISSKRLQNITLSPPDREYPIMRPTPEQVTSWIEEYRSAPTAYLSPAIEAQLAVSPGIEYSLLSQIDYVPSERNQGSCGNCWAWTGTGAMEIAHSRQDNIRERLSIQYLNSNFAGGSGSGWACCGGWLSDVASFYQDTGMAVPWSNANAQWQDAGRSCAQGSTTVPASTISINPNYQVTSIVSETIPTYGVGREKAISNIKNVLAQGRGVFFGFFLPTDSAWRDLFNFWDYQSEDSIWQPDGACGMQYNYNQGGGHAVLCVGYDDTDPNNRYWIMLNSWGSSSRRPNGLFRVSMDMNYDCSYRGLGDAFYWMALNMEYADVENNPPDTPNMPDGPAEGLANHQISFTTSATDPDGDRIRYVFDWGDGTSSATDYESSGICVSAVHSWCEGDDYEVRVRAEDEDGAQSDQSLPASISITSSTTPPDKPQMPSGPASGFAGSLYSYSASATDPDGDLVKYIFDWGDKSSSETELVSSGTSASASHTWSTPGDYKVSAKAVDSQGYESEWSDQLSVQISQNDAPGVPSEPSGPESGDAGVSYTYSTKASDPNGDQVKYTFDWGDESTTETELVPSDTGAEASHAWASGGIYLVTATATDDKGLSSVPSSALSVSMAAPNRAPETPAVPSGKTSIYTGSPSSYSTSASDPDGDSLIYTFDWGDGSTGEADLVPSGKTQSLSHIWTAAGTYYLRAKATDDAGSDSDWSGALSVRVSLNNLPLTPAAPSGSISGFSGTSYSYSAVTTDSDRDRLTYTFDWGDGTTTETAQVRSGLRTSASHAWDTTGSYEVTVRATDSKGGTSGTSSPLIVAITSNSPPLSPALPSGPDSGRTRVYYSYSASTTDPDDDQLKFTFDWGDGTTSQSSLISSGSAASLSHRWSRTGTFSVRAMATDSKGASSEWSPSLTVTISYTLNSPPEQPLPPRGADKGFQRRSYYYSATASDPDGDSVKYVFDWGDGTQTESWAVRTGTTASARHLWNKAGTYQVRVEAVDLKGASSGWSDARTVQIS
ncbi:MAG: PKD domain-containing protein [Methanotrichaceae archaeon]|nr:PKD domain-containing protein [Methanotrichaceae archaeon]